MDKYSEDTENDEFEYRKERGRRIFILSVVTALVLFAVFAAYDTLYGKGVLYGLKDAFSSKGSFSSVAGTKKGSIAADEAEKSTFIAYKNGIMQCSKDGTRFFDSEIAEKWSDTYTMTSPVVVNEGEYTAVAETLGRSVRVYTSGGLLYTLSTEAPIASLSVAKNGYTGVILNNKTYYSVNIYDENGNIAPAGRKEESENVYPVSVSVSEDKRVFAVSYMDVSDIGTNARVLMFYINAADGKNFQDNMFAAVQREDSLIPYIRFMGEDLIAVSDREIIAVDPAGSEKWSKKFNNKIVGVSFKSEDCIIAALGEENANESGEKEGTVIWLDKSGKEKGRFEAGEEITYLNSSGGNAVIGCGNRYTAVSSGGNVIWEYSSAKEVYDMLFLDGKNCVLAVSRTSADVIDMGSK